MPGARTAADLVDLLADCYTRRRWDDILGLLHPQARLVTSVGGAEPLDRDDTVERIRRAMDDVNYRPPDRGALRIRAIDDHAAVATGYLRVPGSTGGHKLVARTWLYTVLDGLVYRAVPLPDEHAAHARYAADGIGLGM
jgi:hypothetical protein